MLRASCMASAATAAPFFASQSDWHSLTFARIPPCEPQENFTTLLSPRTDNGQLAPFPVVKCKNVYLLPGAGAAKSG